MTNKRTVINIYDTDLVWKQQIDNINYLIHRTSWHEMPNSELKVSKTAQGIEEMQIGRILVVNNQTDKALIIEDMTTTLTDNEWTFNLIPLKAMLNYRIAHPLDSGGLGGNPWTAENQSEVMVWMVKDNLISQTRDEDRKFYNSARTKNMLAIPVIKPLFGEIIDFAVDWKTGLMGDALVTISKMYAAGQYPLGWNIYIPSTFDIFQMAVYQAVNRTINQVDRPPVVFSEEFGNIKNATYTYSIKDWRNVVYMNWNNGTTDQNTPVGNTLYGATQNFNRKEMIIDSSKKTSNEITNEGRSELNKRLQVESFTAEIINNENTLSTFGEHWFLGDIVTIQSKALIKNSLISVDAQITEIEEIYDNGEYSINARFGEGKLSFVQLIKNAINQK